MTATRYLCGAALLLSLAVGVAAAETDPPGSAPGLRLEWDARAGTNGGTVISGYIYNANDRPAIKVRLLAEALDESGQVIDRATVFVFGNVPVGGRSYWIVPMKTPGARYRVTVAFYELKEGGTN